MLPAVNLPNMPVLMENTRVRASVAISRLRERAFSSGRWINLKLPLGDGVVIDTALHVIREQRDVPAHSEYWVVWLHGNGET